MKNRPSLLWGLLAVPLVNLFYLLLNHPGSGTYSLVTDLDNLIPFAPVFVIPYMLWMPFLYGTLVYLHAKDRAVYARALLGYVAGCLICFAVYFVFQTSVPRPALSGDGLLVRLVAFVYRHDAPFNCFPSIHCMSSYLLFAVLHRSRVRTRRNAAVIGSLSGLIIVSTQLVKQHVLLDAVAGIALAHAVVVAAEAVPLERWISRSRKKPAVPYVPGADARGN